MQLGEHLTTLVKKGDKITMISILWARYTLAEQSKVKQLSQQIENSTTLR